MSRAASLVRRALLTLVVGANLVAPAAANPIRYLHRGGAPAATGGVTQACATDGSSVCARFQNGQTFVTWTDLATGSAGNDWRYTLVRSTAPITPANWTSATVVASHIFNNSGQLFGGDPASPGGATLTQANRQSAAQPMVVLSAGGPPLAYGTGLQVYTALAPASAHYAIVANPCPNGICTGGTDTYVGSVGPIAETVATPAPIQYADSLSRGQTIGRITSPTGKGIVIAAHASSLNSGQASGFTNSVYGDYWEWFLTTGEGWQDGRLANLMVMQDTQNAYSGLNQPLVFYHRADQWDPLGQSSMEDAHLGYGLTPNPLVGPPNRKYKTTKRMIERMLRFTIDHYGADANAIYWTGQSLGGQGAALTAMRLDPPLAAIYPNEPTWRYDQSLGTGGYWPGYTWTAAMPFKATIGAAPKTLGSDASAVLMDDGVTAWGGTGGWADLPTFIAANPGDDLPVVVWTIQKDDYTQEPRGFGQQVDAVNAFKAAARGFAMQWNMGSHDLYGWGVINCDNTVNTDASICYPKSLFKLNVPYVAFRNGSIDDDVGTGARDANGFLDGAPVGCINCGFKWTFTTDAPAALNLTIDNLWMDRSPTVLPTTTLATGISDTYVGSINLTDASGFLANGQNAYLRVGDEVIQLASRSGNVGVISARGALNTNPLSHAAGETVTQYVTTPTGPNGGPYASMTVDVTPRRLQGFVRPAGTVVSCQVTPDGEGAVTMTGTVFGSHGVFTLVGVKINASGATVLACS